MLGLCWLLLQCRTLWLLVFIVNLAGFRITMATHLWVCLRVLLIFRAI